MQFETYWSIRNTLLQKSKKIKLITERNKV